MSHENITLQSTDQKAILKLLTAGSVDDGKSTLIGRLLHDSKQVYDDHLDTLHKESSKRGCQNGNLDFSLLLDGLKAEREQNITIDVAYRYFSTPKRKFILADAPGHEQYTKNMVTGASKANLLLLLVNAEKGILSQTRRHSFIGSLMGIQHFVIAVNKMDLVGYSEEVFESIKREFLKLPLSSSIKTLHFIPISASLGDNVVEKSSYMPWFKGKPLLNFLEEIDVEDGTNLNDLRFPVQLVLRPSSSFRGYAGTVASGILNRGDELVVLPSGQKSKVQSIFNGQEEVTKAFATQAISLVLENEIDICRGDMLSHIYNQPKKVESLCAMLIWMDGEKEGKIGNYYLLKHTTKTVPIKLDQIYSKVDINTLNEELDTDKALSMNDISSVKLLLNHPIFVDLYTKNKNTGSFILIDPISNQTVAAGIITESQAKSGVDQLENRSVKPRNCVIWLTGLSGSGKTTIALSLKNYFDKIFQPAYVLDGDVLRLGLNSDLGFSSQDRAENIRRLGEVAALFVDAGMIAIVSLISPYEKDRLMARKKVPKGSFYEVFLDAPLEVCERRDPKELYKKARSGEIKSFTGLSAPYEKPRDPELVLDTETKDLDFCVKEILKLVL